MEYTKEDISNVISQYNKLYEKISEVVDLIGKKDNLPYEITSLEESEGLIIAQVEYYKWQDVNHSVITFNCNLLTDPESLEQLKIEVEEVVKERKAKKMEEAKRKHEAEIEKALKLLKEKGYEVNENRES